MGKRQRWQQATVVDPGSQVGSQQAVATCHLGNSSLAVAQVFFNAGWGWGPDDRTWNVNKYQQAGTFQ